MNKVYKGAKCSIVKVCLKSENRGTTDNAKRVQPSKT